MAPLNVNSLWLLLAAAAVAGAVEHTLHLHKVEDDHVVAHWHVPHHDELAVQAGKTHQRFVLESKVNRYDDAVEVEPGQLKSSFVSVRLRHQHDENETGYNAYELNEGSPPDEWQEEGSVYENPHHHLTKDKMRTLAGLLDKHDVHKHLKNDLSPARQHIKNMLNVLPQFFHGAPAPSVHQERARRLLLEEAEEGEDVGLLDDLNLNGDAQETEELFARSETWKKAVVGTSDHTAVRVFINARVVARRRLQHRQLQDADADKDEPEDPVTGDIPDLDDGFTALETDAAVGYGCGAEYPYCYNHVSWICGNSYYATNFCPDTCGLCGGSPDTDWYLKSVTDNCNHGTCPGDSTWTNGHEFTKRGIIAASLPSASAACSTSYGLFSRKKHVCNDATMIELWNMYTGVTNGASGWPCKCTSGWCKNGWGKDRRPHWQWNPVKNDKWGKLGGPTMRTTSRQRNTARTAGSTASLATHALQPTGVRLLGATTIDRVRHGAQGCRRVAGHGVGTELNDIGLQLVHHPR